METSKQLSKGLQKVGTSNLELNIRHRLLSTRLNLLLTRLQSTGNVSQFAEVPQKTKDRSRSKVKETSHVETSATGRGNRARGAPDSARAARGRGDRGRGGFRGGRGTTHATTNGARSADAGSSVPTAESTAYTGVAAADAAAQPIEAPEAKKVAPVPEEPPKKTWASMFAKPKPVAAPPKPVAHAPIAKEAPPISQEEPVAEPDSAPAEPEPGLAPPVTQAETPDQPSIVEEKEVVPEPPVEEAANTDIPQPKDQLTEENVEHLPDDSNPAPEGTVASTVASGSVIGASTPAPQAPIGRPALGGFATTALKATATPRSASFQRRLFEQQEAVVMPGNHAVDRAAVQFGNFNLNGDQESPLDEEEDREEVETRTQPPQHSPTAQPRTSLPPAIPRQPQAPTEAPLSEAPSVAPKQAPGLPPVPQQQQQQPSVGAQQQSPQNPIPSQTLPQQNVSSSQPYGQFGRYSQPGAAAESTPAQKSYDPFGAQTSQASQYDNFPGQTANHQQNSGLVGFSSAPSDYPSYYNTADQRNAYQNYYNSYGQQANTYNQQQQSSNQEAGASQQRTGSAFGSAPSDSAFPSSQAQQVPSRYGETQNSGQNTPNPAQTQQGQQNQHMHQQPHNQSGHAGGYGGYGHPYYQTPYYQNYMSQYGGYGGQGFGPYGGKGSMYGQPHHGYGMSPQTPYDQHSSSPANAGGFGQSSVHGREGLLAGGGFNEYGRSNSTQPSSAASANAGFGNASDPFGRSQGAFPNQTQSYSQQQTSQQAGGEDALKPFGDSKTSAGPSPSLGQPGRPGSATNTTSGQSNQSGIQQNQSQQQGFGGYPSHLGAQGNQYGGLGGLGSHQSGPQSYQAGGYGYGGFGGNHYSNRGWGANFSGHQNH